MRLRFLIPCAAVVAAALAGWGALAPAVPAEDEWDGLPAGPGREQVYYTCAVCHSLALVKQQGLDRESWDETLVWMVEEQEMQPLAPVDRKLVLDYLAMHYGLDLSGRRRRIR